MVNLTIADWKLAVASTLKARTTETNRWLATIMKMGNLHEVMPQGRRLDAPTRPGIAQETPMNPKPLA